MSGLSPSINYAIVAAAHMKLEPDAQRQLARVVHSEKNKLVALLPYLLEGCHVGRDRDIYDVMVALSHKIFPRTPRLQPSSPTFLVIASS